MAFSLVAGLVVAVLNMVVGFIWYGPLFSKLWMREVGLSEKEIGNGPGIGYLYTMVAAFIMGCVASFLVGLTGVTSVADGLVLGLLIGVGFVATSFATTYIFSMRSLKLYFIDVTYQVITIVLAGAVGVLVR